MPNRPRVPLSTASQAALRSAATIAGRRGAREVTPLDVVAALMVAAASAAASDVAPTTRPRLGSALAEAIRVAAGRAERARAPAIDVDDLLAAAVAVAAGDRGVERRMRGRAAGLGMHDWPDGDAPAVDRLVGLLARRQVHLVVLTGGPGVVPERVVAALERRLAGSDIPHALAGTRVVPCDVAPPLQSLGHRVRAQLRDLESDAADVVAVVPDVATVVDAPGGVDAVAEALSAGVRLISTGEAHAVDRLERVDALRRFVRALPVPEASPQTAAAIVRAEAERIGAHHGVAVKVAAGEAAVWLSVRHDHDRALPGKALDLLEDACARASAHHHDTVDVAEVADVAGGGAALPGGLLAAQPGAVADLQSRLRQRVVGQDRAVAGVANAILRAETGVRDPGRPLGSFLFLGPTGVGKTELARTLVGTLFGDEAALIRLDMGEYQEAHAVARLVGAPPGYVGYEHGGHLTEPLRRRPYSVVLLDEIEKAHPDVLNTLLAVLDEGRLTDGYGRVVDARHAVLIMTSNLGSRVILDPTLSDDVIDQRVREAVVEHFPPEFHSRVDDVVVFRRLSREDLLDIVDLHVGRLTRRLADRDLHVSVDADVRSWLVAQVTDSPHGARPLRTAIRRNVEDVIARAVLDGRVRPGARAVLTLRDRGVELEVTPSW